MNEQALKLRIYEELTHQLDRLLSRHDLRALTNGHGIYMPFSTDLETEVLDLLRDQEGTSRNARSPEAEGASGTGSIPRGDRKGGRRIPS